MRYAYSLLSTVLLFSLAACGGEVSPGTSGAGGSGGGAGGAGGGGPTGEQACLDFCHKMETNNCGQMTDCTKYCDEVFANGTPKCTDELGAMYACYLAEIGTTCPKDSPAACMSQTQAAQACQAMYGCTGESGCTGSSGPNGTTCGCTETCVGKAYETSCTTDPNTMKTTCDCKVNGASVGTCDGSPNACGIKDSCCQTQYFKL
jgi:hypothetical protein